MTDDPKRKQKGEKDQDSEMHIPLVPLPDESAELEAEIQEIFEEDQVTHRHGSTEPERD